MDKQTTIAFVLIGAILVLWLYFSTPKQTDQTGKPDTTSINYDTNKTKSVAEEKKQKKIVFRKPESTPED